MRKIYLLCLCFGAIVTSAHGQPGWLGQTVNRHLNKATNAVLNQAQDVFLNAIKKKQAKPAVTQPTSDRAGSPPVQEAPQRTAERNAQVKIVMPASDYAGDPAVAADWLHKAEIEADVYKKIDYCNQALKADPGTIDAYFNRATYLVELEDYEKAINDYDKLLEYRPDDASGLNGRGYCKHQLGQYKDAIKDYGQSIANNNDEVYLVFNNRGWSYAMAEDYEKAVKDFDQAIKLNPELLEALLRKGWCLQQTGQHNDAVTIFDQIINRQTNYLQAWYLRGLSKAELNRHKESILDFNKVLSQRPEDKDALFARAISYGAMDKYADASEDYSTLIRLDPANSEAYNNRGYCLLKKNQNSDAVSDFTKSLALKNPHPHSVYTNRGKAYAKLQMYKEALADYRQALIYEPNHQDALEGKAFVEQILNPGAGSAVAASRRSNYLNRYALVIGNSSYFHTKSLSSNPLNDAADISKRLEELGFKVTTLKDGNKKQMEEALQTLSSVAQGADLITVFYAGHGIENAGVNYLIPIDAKIDSLKYVRKEAIPLDDVLAKIRLCQPKVGLIFLDACRNSPFRTWDRGNATRTGDPTEEAKRGAFTAPPDLSDNEMVYYATKPKAVANNGTGRNGTLTYALLEHLRRGVELKEMWQGVTSMVHEKTQRTQTPYSSGILMTDLIF